MSDEKRKEILRRVEAVFWRRGRAILGDYTIDSGTDAVGLDYFTLWRRDDCVFNSSLLESWQTIGDEELDHILALLQQDMVLDDLADV